MRGLLFVMLLLLFQGMMRADRLIRIKLETNSDINQIRDMGYEITAGCRTEGWVDILVGQQFVEETLHTFPVSKLLPEEWSELVNHTDGDEMGFYYGPGENAVFWKELSSLNDMVDAPASYGLSYEGRDLEFIRITNAGPDAPVILFTALTHAREPGSNSVVIDWAQWLTAEYENDKTAKFILDNAQIYIIPIVNPDGYHFNNPYGGMQRKNMNWTDGNGVDLNRNFSYKWAYDDNGSSDDPYSGVYRGTAALSEPETLAMTLWIDSIKPLGGFHYHTYGGYLLYPYGYNNMPTPHQSTFNSWAAQMAVPIDYKYGRAGQILYDVNGDAVDWSYGATTHSPMLFFTPEVDDDGFWGSQNDSSLIVKNNLECREMNKILCLNLLDMTGIKEESTAQKMKLVLESNPVSTVLRYIVTGNITASVSVLDLAGRIVAAPSDGIWEIPSGMENGIYFLYADDGSREISQPFTVLR